MKACGRLSSALNPARELTAPSRVQTPVIHTSIHNRLGVLKSSKTHLQQTRISKIFRGTNPRTPATGSALEHNEQGRQLSNAGPEWTMLKPPINCLVRFVYRQCAKRHSPSIHRRSGRVEPCKCARVKRCRQGLILAVVAAGAPAWVGCDVTGLARLFVAAAATKCPATNQRVRAPASAAKQMTRCLPVGRLAC